MATGTKTGNTVDSFEGKFCVYITYTTTETETSYRIQSNYYLKAVTALKKNSIVSWGMTYDLSGSTTGNFTGDTPNVSAGTTLLKFTRDKTFTKGTAAQKYSVTCSIHNSIFPEAAEISKATISFTIPALKSWSVKYNANNGSGAPAAQTKYYGKTLTLSGTKPTRTGYTFTKWNTAAGGSGTNYSAGGSYTANASLTLYAQWSINTYTLTYNAGGGSVSPASKSVTYNAAYGTLPVPVRAGYTFNGWYTAASGGTEVTSATKMGAGNTTIYAQWTLIPYSISYDLDGGTVSPSNPVSYSIETAAFSLNNPYKEHFRFGGWTGTGLSAASQSVTVPKGSTGNRSYTALWERAYWPPVLTLKIARRASESSVDDDSGTIPYVSFTWAEGSDDGSVVTPDCYDILFTNQADPAEVYSLTDQPLTVSPVTRKLDSITLAANKSFDVSVILHQTGFPDVTATDYISQAYFAIDINPDGTGIAFGKPSTQEGFECNMPASFADRNSVIRALFDFVYPVGSYYETSDMSFDPNVTWGGTWYKEIEGQVHISAGSTYNISGADTTSVVGAETRVGTNNGGVKTVALTPAQTAMKEHHHTYSKSATTTKDHTLVASEIPAHTHGSKSLTGLFNIRKWATSSSAGHEVTYTSGIVSVADVTASAYGNANSSYNPNSMDRVTIDATHTHSSVGGGGGHSHGISLTTTNTSDTTDANGSAHNNMQPYIVVNRWHRVA